MRKLDLKAEITRISEFIAGYTAQAGIPQVILGLSGGIDSSLSAALAVKALGKDKVLGAILPHEDSSSHSEDDARLLAQTLEIQIIRQEITFLCDRYFSFYDPQITALRMANWKARCRMLVLYDLSQKHHALVLGTSNRTELLVGYFTQYGDGASAFEPIGHLYKTEVWEMAHLLGIPEQIVNKTPTADLWEGQSDEEEMGIKYPTLDEILFQLTEPGQDQKNSPTIFPDELYDKVRRMISVSEFKRQLPPVLARRYAE
ncbi:MAG: NAD+ synthase [Candidatus Cloacimonetes bacterium]|nr:NAD+ synthase [Candidatus Cloacimonadota bacterium]